MYADPRKEGCLRAPFMLLRPTGQPLTYGQNRPETRWQNICPVPHWSLPVLSLEIPYSDPLALCALLADEPWLAFLDSSASGDPRAQWSYLAIDPFRILLADEKQAWVDGAPVCGTSFDVLERELASYACDGPPDDLPAPFRGGAIGFLGYELGRHLERLPAAQPKTAPAPDMAMGFYDTVVAFNHQQQRAFILSSGVSEQDEAARPAHARQRAEALRARLSPATEKPEPDWNICAHFQPDQTRAEVEAAITQVMAYIHAGDIFQANLTQQMRAPMPDGLSNFALYLRLRTLSPAPFAAFLRCGPDLCIMSASPERFIRLTPDRLLETRPIKGTRPRGKTAEQDKALASELESSAKDRAENLMIVDLMRNDLSRVSEIGSVKVPVLNGLEQFSSVHHLVSVVEGRLKAGLGPVDVLRATFPGGSITGAPKIRAQEIIRELEPFPRGAYCGSIAWIGFDGAMDSSIVIRTITRTGNMLLTHAGGGIVADSDPTAEYEESMVKLAPMLHALSGEAQ